MTEPRKTGTREWSDHSLNLFLGCAHGCRYCYARATAMRLKKVGSEEQWRAMEPLHEKYMARAKKANGVIMFPTQHDLLPKHLDLIEPYLMKWLSSGNKLLIVTKPHVEVMQRLLRYLVGYKPSVTFRFSIGSADSRYLKFWEPEAPDYYERKDCLQMAYGSGYETSVSCEPYLDESIIKVFEVVRPYVTDTIWFGIMNKIESRVNMKGWTDEMMAYYHKVKYISSMQWVSRHLYGDLLIRNDPKTRWKDSIQQLIGIDQFGEKV